MARIHSKIKFFVLFLFKRRETVDML